MIISKVLRKTLSAFFIDLAAGVFLTLSAALSLSELIFKSLSVIIYLYFATNLERRG